jgi:putative endonuclease
LQRLVQHRDGLIPGFTTRYKVHRLVHFEMFGEMEPAIVREKQLKNWHRQWKINLINAENPEWRDLAVGLGLPPLAPGKTRNGS